MVFKLSDTSRVESIIAEAKEKSDFAQTEERIKLALNSGYMDEKEKLNYKKLISAL